MRRKDCDNGHGWRGSRATHGRRGAARTWVVLAGLMSSLCGVAEGQTLRMWSTAVVVGDEIRVNEVCELRGLTLEAEEQLGQAVVGEAPAAGGSRFVTLDQVRSALQAAGINLAEVTLSGATRCAVSRPQVIAPSSGSGDGPVGAAARSGLEARSAGKTARFTSDGNRSTELAAAGDSPADQTLRQAVIDYFANELGRYGGRPEVVFDHTSPQVLELTAPAFSFHVRRRSGPVLGLVPLEVDVLSGGAVVQTVPLVVQVSLIRHTVIARRAINQSATVAAADVELVPMAVTRLDRLGLEETARVVGQRARRFLAAGSAIEASDLETVPVVIRGQLVNLTSVAGSVRVVTTAKAAEDGLLGQVIRVRSVDNRRLEFDARVVGPGKVEVGGAPRETLSAMVMGHERS